MGVKPVNPPLTHTYIHDTLVGLQAVNLYFVPRLWWPLETSKASYVEMHRGTFPI